MARIRAEVTVHGRVQGVGFRYSTCTRAESLGLTGWVKNTWRRTVDALFEGEESDVRSMVRWCEDGPGFAHVTKVDVKYSEATGEFKSFQVAG